MRKTFKSLNEKPQTKEELYQTIRYNLKYNPAYEHGTNAYKLLKKHAPHLFEQEEQNANPESRTPA